MFFQLNNQRFTVKKATLENLDSIENLLIEASKWIESKGLSQWKYYLTNMEGNRNEIVDSIERGDTFVLAFQGEVIGTLTLSDSPTDWDVDIWGDEVWEEESVYLHRVVISRRFKGKGVGQAFLHWAESFCKRKGVKKIRFDCLYNNKNLNSYYQKRYPLKDIVNKFGQHSIYEKIL
ncbi:GNAT family N-acetyltransferase [Rossellomorea aquimaris]|uniref:GNAT family N-acetyltransferase n=1 Tax=Rossellomorea aquimaris TaxID=189382 RepID=UPI0007D0B169|nr:GNAT family N-acetyltransferase [Rossellomorea aquimaris]